MILYVYIGDVADSGGVLTFYISAIIDDESQWPDLECHSAWHTLILVHLNEAL